MKFMIIRKADPETEAGAMPTAQLVSDMMAYNKAMIEIRQQEAHLREHAAARETAAKA
jgi:hypothetical protein